MSELRFDGIREEVTRLARPFMEDVLAGHGENIHSMHITGSALTDDYLPSRSDINSVIVLKRMDLAFLESLAPRGKKLRKENISAPLLMTPEHIKSSSDVFPLEFLNFKLLHKTVYGEDIFGGLEIDMTDLRRQCERELKEKLVGLRQGYLSTMGDTKSIAEGVISSIKGYIPLFRGVIKLKGLEPPLLQADVIKGLAAATGVDCGAFERALKGKREKLRLSAPELTAMFEEYYRATERLAGIVDEIKA